MKKTLTINISGTVFHIDEDAYEKLQNYLHKVSLHFGAESEGREIIQDIESRISELFSQKLKGGEGVINTEMVDDVVSVMGMPEDFLEEEEEQEEVKGSHVRNRRLYRDIDHRMLGGVCSGLSAYFNIDPVILRLLFAVLVIFSSSWHFFSGGTVVIIYLLLWIVVPAAKTTLQKLEMRGEDINISNIERSIKDEYTQVKEKYHNFRSSASYAKGKERMQEAGEVVYSGSNLLLLIIVKVVGVLLIIIGLSSLIALSVGMFAGYQFTDHGFESFNMIPFFDTFLSTGSMGWMWFGLSLALGVPMLMLIYAGTKMLFRYKTNSVVIGFSALGLWLAGVIILVGLGVGQMSNFKESIGHTELKSINTNSNVLYLKMNDSFPKEIDENMNIDFDGVKVLSTDNGRVMVGKPKLDVEVSDNDKYSLEIHYTSKGNDEDDARKNLKAITYNINPKDSVIVFDPFFVFKKNTQWRKQDVKMTLKVPVGKTIYLGDNMMDIIFDINNVTHVWDGDMVGKYWTMTDDGLTLRDSIKVEKNAQKVLNVKKRIKK